MQLVNNLQVSNFIQIYFGVSLLNAAGQIVNSSEHTHVGQIWPVDWNLCVTDQCARFIFLFRAGTD